MSLAQGKHYLHTFLQLQSPGQFFYLFFKLILCFLQSTGFSCRLKTHQTWRRLTDPLSLWTQWRSDSNNYGKLLANNMGILAMLKENHTIISWRWKLLFAINTTNYSRNKFPVLKKEKQKNWFRNPLCFHWTISDQLNMPLQQHILSWTSERKSVFNITMQTNIHKLQRDAYITHNLYSKYLFAIQYSSVPSLISAALFLPPFPSICIVLQLMPL